METIKYVVKAYQSKTKCPHGMQTKTMPIRNDYHGIHYQMIRDTKNMIVRVGSWICTSCLYCASQNGKTNVIQCAYSEQKQLPLFN